MIDASNLWQKPMFSVLKSSLIARVQPAWDLAYKPKQIEIGGSAAPAQLGLLS